tara:strand:+ start:283 stop:606 length:324 start_codon:yes stop_codon:yes gene_type:complete
MNYKIGQKVVALTSPQDSGGQPRIKGKIYEVLDVSYCCKCGSQRINISGNTHECFIDCRCGSTQRNNGLWWTHSDYFAPLTELSLEAAIEAEEYELAAIIRDELIEI